MNPLCDITKQELADATAIRLSLKSSCVPGNKCNKCNQMLGLSSSNRLLFQDHSDQEISASKIPEHLHYGLKEACPQPGISKLWLS